MIVIISKKIAKKEFAKGIVSPEDLKIILKHGIEILASSIIAVHNHPSGNLKPSQADIELTKKLKEAAKLIDIVLLDHLIIGDKKYYSFADEGTI